MTTYRFDFDLYKDNEVYDSSSVDISRASCEDHATELAIDHIEAEYPDIEYYITGSQDFD